MRCAVEAKCASSQTRGQTALPSEYDTTANEERLIRTAVPTLVRMHRLREPGYVQASPGGRQPARTLPPFVKHENRAIQVLDVFWIQ